MTRETEKAPTRRPYRKGRRAELEAATRLRITEAAVKLHGSVGPARTTIQAVADEAGVQRATVYRHFPDEEALFAACSAHWASLRPPPTPEEWRSVSDPDVRLRAALASVYRWYAWAEPMLANTLRDAPLVPAMDAARARLVEHFAAIVASLLEGRRVRGARRRRTVALIGHAIAFATWRSLVREHGLEPAETVDLMARLVAMA